MELQRFIAAVGLAVISAPAWFGQTTAHPKAFAVASVKLNTSVHGAINNKFGPDSMRWTNISLKSLIETAYGLTDYQVAGAAGWTDSERWDVDAKCDGPASFAEKLEMLRSLLEERFHLQFRRETRQLPSLRLEIAKNGPKLATARPEDADHKWGTRVDRGLLEMSGATMPMLVFWLSSQLNLPVVDNTGLTGTYDLRLEWAQDVKLADAGGDPSSTDGEQSIFAAVEAQLGLKLVAVKSPVEVLAIEHAERASGN
ncbi:MAG TPA: TIGR03435 family protein [Bryobacteraceae bacterium]|jgi:uncharacterized protein (TIGR03435 family)|nr:TIGR03435 family protein [Bryobacteraceae bacterium]